MYDTFTQEVERSTRRLRDAVDPYARFVRAEYERLQDVQQVLGEVAAEVDTLVAVVQGRHD